MTYDEQLISNSSYTNKDFQSIYPALLDLVKKITYRWDPSISNESDPGVILLKLNAIIADKCNYNIDKNVLECFPLSVTQERNARQLYAQLGYYMHWYMAATGTVSLRWSANVVNDKTYTIPKFTMLSDEDKEVVYTIVNPLPLPLDGTFMTYDVIQGVAVNYTVNGDTLITSQNLDANNRLYFTDTNIAQNGVFIRNANQLNYDDWIRKDNLAVESVSAQSRFYSFGVSLDTNICYIEFPVNAQELFGDGIEITYIKTNGYYGNVGPFTISRFYDDLVINDGSNTQTLDSTNVQMTNFNAITNGEDAESITDAYNGYKKVIGTFDTLITLRDYINAILRYPNVSNGFVCDRTNDVDCTVSVVESINKLDTVVNEALKSNGFNIYPFDLKFYMLYAIDEYSDLTTNTQFKNTFRLLEDIDLENGTVYAKNVLDSLQEIKSIQQNLNSLLTIGVYDTSSTGVGF